MKQAWSSDARDSLSNGINDGTKIVMKHDSALYTLLSYDANSVHERIF